MSEEENAIETLKEVASDDFDTLGDDISPKMAQSILNVISKQQKEIEELKEKNKKLETQVAGDKIQRLEYQKFLVQDFISKDKIRAKIKELEDNMILFTNYKEKFNRYKYARDILEKTLGE